MSEILFFSAKSKRRPSLIYSMQIIPVCLSIVARRKGVSATRRGGLNWTPISLLVGHPCKLFHINTFLSTKKLIYGLRKAPSKPSSSFRGSMSRIFTSNVAPQSVTADNVQSILEPRIDDDIILVTDGNNIYPRCAKSLGTEHEALNQSAGERVRGVFNIHKVNNRHSLFNLNSAVGARQSSVKFLMLNQ